MHVGACTGSKAGRQVRTRACSVSVRADAQPTQCHTSTCGFKNLSEAFVFGDTKYTHGHVDCYSESGGAICSVALSALNARRAPFSQSR